MASVDEPEYAEPDHQETSADLDLLLPFDEGDQQCEGKDHYNIARRWPAVSGQSANKRALLSISSSQT
jgi:hypothetical protein